MSKTIKSTCIYCGCGCQLNYEVEGEKIIKVSPVANDPVSQGKPCVKGLTLNDLDNSDRLQFPLIKKGEKLEKADWEETKKYIYENIKDLSPEQIAFVGSGEFTNEDNFVLSKFAHLISKTNNIDCCARLCHSSTTVAMHKMFGNTAMPNFIDDITESDLIITIGTNPPSNYPVVFNRISDAKKKGSKIVCVDIETSEMSKSADIFIRISFTEITTLFAGIIRKLIALNIIDQSKKSLDGFEKLTESVNKFDENYITDKCKIKTDDFNKLLELIKNAKKVTLMHGMGVTQHANGVNNITAILNLAILVNANIIPMRGKINVQGSGDMGTCRDWIPFGGSISQTEEVWGEILNDVPGHHLTEFFYDLKIKAIFIMGGNPAQSMPDLNRLYSRIKSAFIIYMHHHPSCTMDFANVVVPTPLLFENNGTITNAERRVRYVLPINNIAETVPPAWKFLSDLAKLFEKEKDFSYKNTDEIFEEIKKAAPAYAALDLAKIKSDDDNFADKEKFFERFLPINDTNPERGKENPTYPILLTTQRSIHHFCTGELTRRNKKLMKFTTTAFCEMNESDAEKYGIKSGDKVEIESSKGSVRATAKVSPEYQTGIVTLPFHFESCMVNKLFDLQLDPISKEPNLKAAWVRIKKV